MLTNMQYKNNTLLPLKLAFYLSAITIIFDFALL